MYKNISVAMSVVGFFMVMGTAGGLDNPDAPLVLLTVMGLVGVCLIAGAWAIINMNTRLDNDQNNTHN